MFKPTKKNRQPPKIKDAVALQADAFPAIDTTNSIQNYAMNISDLMKQAQQFQEKLSTVQNELGQRQVTGSAGGGMVTATFNGKGELLDLSIDQALVTPENTQMLQDLVTAAVNDGLNKAKELGKTEMARLTGGLSIPGLL